MFLHYRTVIFELVHHFFALHAKPEPDYKQSGTPQTTLRE